MNVRAERMGWLPTAPQLATNPLSIAAAAEKAGLGVQDHVVRELRSGDLRMACEDPDNPINFPRNLFIWRSNLFGSSGQGAPRFPAPFPRHAGTVCKARTSARAARESRRKSSGTMRRRKGNSTSSSRLIPHVNSCLYSDVVLPTASWYEKNDLNTSDMHTFIHPLSAAVDPVWESRSDWETYKTIARRFSELCRAILAWNATWC